MRSTTPMSVGMGIRRISCGGSAVGRAVLHRPEVLDEAVEEAGEGGAVGGRPAVEHVGHVAVLDRGDALADPAAGRRRPHDPDPGVAVAAPALDQAVGLQGLDLPAHGAGVHVGRRREVAEGDGAVLDDASQQRRARAARARPRRPRPGGRGPSGWPRGAGAAPAAPGSRRTHRHPSPGTVGQLLDSVNYWEDRDQPVFGPDGGSASTTTPSRSAVSSRWDHSRWCSAVQPSWTVSRW